MLKVIYRVPLELSSERFHEFEAQAEYFKHVGLARHYLRTIAVCMALSLA